MCERQIAIIEMTFCKDKLEQALGVIAKCYGNDAPATREIRNTIRRIRTDIEIAQERQYA